MRFLNIDQIQSAINGELISKVATEFSGVGTDSRVDLTQKVFIALRGENFDAHNFLDKALQQKATLLIVDQFDENNPAKDQVSIIKVKDTLTALQDLAHFWREYNQFKVIGITGSNGKTTTKEFCASMLSTKYKTSFSKGSFNNHWGVPITLLEAPQDSEFVICEMGMNHTGELAALSKIAQPDIVVCTTVGSSHIGELGSVEAVAAAKSEIYHANPKAIAVFNLSNQQTLTMFKKQASARSQVLTFSIHPEDKADVSLQIDQMELTSLTVVGLIAGVSGKKKVNVFGRQNVHNLMAACCLAMACGMSGNEIWQALSHCKTVWGRNQLYQTSSGAHIIFDGYNANLESVTALLENLNEISVANNKIVILGEMFELGPYTKEYHQTVGETVARLNFDQFWFLGPSKDAVAAGIKLNSCQTQLTLTEDFDLEMAKHIKNCINKGDIIAIKGSRGMRLERILEVLVDLKKS